MSDNNAWVWMAITTLIIGFFLGGFASQSLLREQAIKHGVAQYNARTAAFEWKECGK